MRIITPNLYESACHSSMMKGTRNIVVWQEEGLAHKSLRIRITRPRKRQSSSGTRGKIPVFLIDVLHSGESMPSIGHEMGGRRCWWKHPSGAPHTNGYATKASNVLVSPLGIGIENLVESEDQVQVCLVLLYVSWCSIDAFAFVAMCMI